MTLKRTLLLPQKTTKVKLNKLTIYHSSVTILIDKVTSFVDVIASVILKSNNTHLTAIFRDYPAEPIPER